MNCKSELHLADDYGDNQTTFKCQLKEKHENKHQEKCRWYDNLTYAHHIMIEWVGDDRECQESYTNNQSDDKSKYKCELKLNHIGLHRVSSVYKGLDSFGEDNFIDIEW